MKSADEIKKGLECCIGDDEDICCDGCAYCGEVRCVRKMTDDTLTLIQRLEADNAQLNRCIENMTDKLNAANDEVAKLQVERDAAVALIPHACAYCKWYGTKHGGFFPDCKNPSGCKNISGINTGWQWRGVQKEE